VSYGLFQFISSLNVRDVSFAVGNGKPLLIYDNQSFVVHFDDGVILTSTISFEEI